MTVFVLGRCFPLVEPLKLTAIAVAGEDHWITVTLPLVRHRRRYLCQSALKFGSDLEWAPRGGRDGFQ
jgi:hypothetical protein